MSQPVLKGENGSWSPQGGGVSSACSHGGLPSTPTPWRLFLFVTGRSIPHFLQSPQLAVRETEGRLSRALQPFCPAEQLSSAEGCVHVFLCVCACTGTLVLGTGVFPSPRLTQEEVRSLQLSGTG